MKNALAALGLILFIVSCTKPGKNDTVLPGKDDAASMQQDYIEQIKIALQDSLAANDSAQINFMQAYKTEAVQKGYYYLRLGLTGRDISTDFILLFTNNAGHIVRGRIVHVNKEQPGDSISPVPKYSFMLSTLDGKKVKCIVNKRTSGNTSQLLDDDEGAIGEQVLPAVYVTAYIYQYEGYYSWLGWYLYDVLSGDDDIGGGGGGGTFTYGQEMPPKPKGYSDPELPDDAKQQITIENSTDPAIELEKFLNCFSKLSDAGAKFEISIFADLPVNSDPYQLFDPSTGACGHAFIQLKKTSNGTLMQQNIGFYPASGWKSIEANGPVASKMVDNSGHEFNASLNVTVDAAHFQSAINAALYEGKAKYDIDNNNCTDFALKVFNAAAPIYLGIPQYHIPGGMYGELSNTPQGLYNQLKVLNDGAGYQGGSIVMPGVLGVVGQSNGACN